MTRNPNKSENLISLLQGMKQEATEELSLVQFRIPAGFKKELDTALKAEGLWPRDVFVAAAQLVIRNHQESKQASEPESTPEKPKQTVLLRKNNSQSN